MEISTQEAQVIAVVGAETGYSWTRKQLDEYEESWERDQDNQD